jgi:peptide/nickel transport system permease protein
MFLGLLLLLLIGCIALGAPLLTTIDPEEINPIDRLQSPSFEHWFGTDHLGRDLFARTMYGSRISLTVGVCVSTMSTLFGLVIGLVAGYHRRLDAIVMRVMDGLMAIPGILLAIALMALMRASVRNVIVALIIPEIPRVVRLVRALVLSLREQPFVEAVQAAGAGIPRMLVRGIAYHPICPKGRDHCLQGLRTSDEFYSCHGR